MTSSSAETLQRIEIAAARDAYGLPTAIALGGERPYLRVEAFQVDLNDVVASTWRQMPSLIQLANFSLLTNDALRQFPVTLRRLELRVSAHEGGTLALVRAWLAQPTWLPALEELVVDAEMAVGFFGFGGGGVSSRELDALRAACAARQVRCVIFDDVADERAAMTGA